MTTHLKKPQSSLNHCVLVNKLLRTVEKRVKRPGTISNLDTHQLHKTSASTSWWCHTIKADQIWLQDVDAEHISKLCCTIEPYQGVRWRQNRYLGLGKGESVVVDLVAELQEEEGRSYHLIFDNLFTNLNLVDVLSERILPGQAQFVQFAFGIALSLWEKWKTCKRHQEEPWLCHEDRSHCCSLEWQHCQCCFQ